MRKELELKLKEDFPQLYRDLYGDMSETCMHWGFECGDGWYDIIRDLSQKLTDILDKMPEEEKAVSKAAQVKEKWGSLSFYFDGFNNYYDEIYKVIGEASDKTFETCEQCGKPGKASREGWVRVRCEEHSDRRTAPLGDPDE